MSKQLFETLLAKFKKANKQRKEKLAKDAGYSTIDGYEKYLKEMINTSVEEAKTVKETNTTTVHIVNILDVSGSMRDKLKDCKKALKDELKALQSETDGINYVYSLILFSDYSYYHYLVNKTLVCGVDSGIIDSVEHMGMTALYDAVYKTLDYFRDVTDKVLVKIYTDGEENGSTTYTSKDASRLIEDLNSKNFTITFVGTDTDVDNVIRKLRIDPTNTLKYDGTSKGLADSIAFSNDARVNYSKELRAGNDVRTGFYKSFNKK